MVAALRDEITRRKGRPGWPNQPSGMERGIEPKSPGSCSERERVIMRGSTRSKLAIHEERTPVRSASTRSPAPDDRSEVPGKNPFAEVHQVR
jgi:hypothetical protein